MKNRFNILLWVLGGIFLLLLLEILLQPFPRNGENVFFKNENPNFYSHDNSYQITNQKEHNLSDFLENAFFTFLGGLASGLVGVWLFFYQRRSGARDTFKVFISLKKSEIQMGKCLNFYIATKEEIREMVFKTMPFLTKKQRIRLKKIWQEYNSGETAWKFENGYESASDRMIFKGDKEKFDRLENLHGFMDKFFSV